VFFSTSGDFTVKEEHILNVSENRVLKIIFGSKSKNKATKKYGVRR
jgi:uncharacterized protein YifE (UPF0438 family)